MRTIRFKKMVSAAAFVLAFGFFIQSAYASQITIVVPNSAPPEINETQTKTGQEVFPVSVVESYDESGRSIVTRRYELSRAERPENIPREDFTFGSKSYTLTDIIKSPNQNVELKPVTEAVEVSSPTNKLEQIMPLLESEIPYDDGQFTGTLTLDTTSISVTEAGRKTSSRIDTTTRQYPNLSNRDVSLIPKSISQNGVNYTLTDVGWTAGNTSAVDYTGIADYYTANATYSGSISSTRVTGYTVTANYTGEVGYTNADIFVYEAVFMEVRHLAQIVTPEPSAAETSKPDTPISVGEEETPTDAPEALPSAPVVKEISRDELLEILSGGEETLETTPTPDENIADWLPVILLAAAAIIVSIIILKRSKKFDKKF